MITIVQHEPGKPNKTVQVLPEEKMTVVNWFHTQGITCYTDKGARIYPTGHKGRSLKRDIGR